MSIVPSSRVGGAAGLLFAAGVLLQNGFLLRDNPMPGAQLDQIVAFYAGSSARVSVAVGWVAINIPLLLLFGSAVSLRLERQEAARVWARVGLCGVVLLCAAFSCTTWLQGVLVARAADLATAGQLQLVWDLHSAAFSSSGLALAATMGGFSLGAWQGGVVPRWAAGVGLVGAAALVASGLFAVGTITGGPGIFLQLLGFVAWLVWLVTASVRLLRPQ